MNYDVFLSDFDGTLVRSDGTISQKNIDAITKFRDMGGIFAIVTGRMLSSIRPRLKELGIFEGIVVAYQGAMIADIATGKLLKNDGLSTEQALKTLRILEAEDLHIHLYNDDVFYCNKDDEYLREYERVCGVKAVVPNEPLSEKIMREKMNVVKILAMVSPEKRDELRFRLEERLGKKYNVTSSAQFMVEVLPANVSKAAAVKFLSEYYRIPIERIAAIGDQLNDLPMIEAAGGKFAVANAEEILKQRAVVVPSCEEDGVAVAITKYAF